MFRRRRGKLRLVAIGLVLGGALIATYYVREVRLAQAQTPELVRRALAAPMELAPEDLSAEQLRALLAVQDPQFFEHKGWNFAGGTVTTITQSLVKRLYFEHFRAGPLNKLRQSLIARFALDPQLSKRDQLRLFINTVWLGNVGGKDVVGLAAGARSFYGKPFMALSSGEFLSLLVFDRPATLNPRADPLGNAERVARIQRLLAGKCQPQRLVDRLLWRAPGC